jgi:hypothetical protein
VDGEAGGDQGGDVSVAAMFAQGVECTPQPGPWLGRCRNGLVGRGEGPAAGVEVLHFFGEQVRHVGQFGRRVTDLPSRGLLNGFVVGIDRSLRGQPLPGFAQHREHGRGKVAERRRGDGRWYRAQGCCTEHDVGGAAR